MLSRDQNKSDIQVVSVPASLSGGHSSLDPQRTSAPASLGGDHRSCDTHGAVVAASALAQAKSLPSPETRTPAPELHGGHIIADAHVQGALVDLAETV